jgi:thiamine biosynthesis protein ThiI
VYHTIIARFAGEIGTKGKNRSEFEKTLIENMRRVLKPIPGTKVVRSNGRILVELEDPVQMDEALSVLRDVFGIVSLSPVAKAPLELQDIQQVALRELLAFQERSGRPVRTFRVETRRANRQFPLTSMEVSRKVGGYILKQLDGAIPVDLHNPDCTVSIELRDTETYVYTQVYDGPGGLPVGTSGKGLLLLSGGIDSPVAGIMGMRRGLEIEAVHFHSYPFTSERALQKVQTLAQILSYYGGRVVLHVVPFTEIQKHIRQHCHEELSVTIMRRFMIRISEQIARNRKILALLTGESLGQVASQTLESMYTINHVTNLPILRPLVAMDKLQVIEIAKQIGTYETSILPYEDCCTIFLPKNPATKPKVAAAEREEAKLDVETLVADAVERTETMVYYGDKLDMSLLATRTRA